MTQSRRSGFTLIELVMVIVIIAVLSAIVIPNYINYAGRSAAATTRANLSTLRSAVQQYRAQNNDTLPAALSDLVPTYIAAIPKDGVQESQTVVGALDGTGGWIYSGGTVFPNLAGSDAYGVNYSDY